MSKLEVLDSGVWSMGCGVRDAGYGEKRVFDRSKARQPGS
jgi:hypothetical protein